jgi:hypothetical protein
MKQPVKRPDCEMAFAFQTFACGDPNCGLHFVPERRDGTPICEMIIGRDGVRDLLDMIHDEGLDL